MSLEKAYIPKDHEAKVYQLWEDKKAFAPQDTGKGKFSMVIPPPNANGDLHMGHGLTLAIEDIAVRYNRMQGKATLFIPGADHAGFETQSVYERILASRGESRFDFNREELYSQIWDFVELNKNNYQGQLRRLGASLSWDNFTYTLDQKVVKTAYNTFKKMWDEGLIYRGERLVNYCTFHGTGFADIEVEYKEKAGYIWSIKYPLTDGSGEIIVATTRPETMLGDVAVAVHPDDERYKQMVGKTVKLPLTEREIPIIADDFVETEFGTGAVKITPAHDPNDYEAGQRHDLPMISVIGHDGLINHNAPEEFQKLTVAEAREAVVNKLTELGLLAETKEHQNNVGHCYKCGTVIEPLLKEQWFVSMKPLAKRATESIKAGQVQFYPKNRANQLVEYLENLRDWNISRQIAWGIPIPAFQNADNPDDWIFDERTDQQIIEVDGKTYHRDPDVFDTWFSSSSWPYVTLDYPDGDNYQKFYPLDLMETGFDILYPWVSRMLMMGLYVTDQVPFRTVYLHGLIQDEHGAKMSKSKGNVINPMEKIDEFGSDAFRMGIIADESPASSRPYDESKMVGARNFCNKTWNVARYIEGALGDSLDLSARPEPVSVADHWILARLGESQEYIDKQMASYGFSEAYGKLYHTIWDELADWYIEASKSSVNASVLNYALATVLKLAHPFAPFVTEAIWQNLGGEGLLITSDWPTVADYDVEMSNQFVTIQSIVTEVRGIKAEINLSGGVLGYGDDTVLESNKDMIAKLAKLEGIEQGGQGIRLTTTGTNCWFVMDDGTAKRYSDSLHTKLTDVNKQISALEGRLSNETYVAKAPSHLVEESRTQLADLQTQASKLTTQLKNLG